MLKIIFVDDEIYTVRMLKEIFDWHRIGIEVAGDACNGMEALKLVDAVKPDIIIVDIKMPVMDGLAFMHEIRQRGCNAAVIVLSAYGEFEYAQRAIDYGAKGYQLKPIDEKKLLKMILEIRNSIIKENMKSVENEQYGGMGIPYNNYIEKAKEYIKQNYSSSITLESISEHVSVSKNYLCKIFKQEEDKSIWDYLTEKRIEKSKRLLRETNYKIYEIATSVGYESIYYFNKIFKKCTNMTPLEFRNTIGGNKIL